MKGLWLMCVWVRTRVCVCVQGCREAVIWLAVHHKQKKALELFSREVAPAGTGMGTSVHTSTVRHVTQLGPLVSARKHECSPMWRSLTNALVLPLSSWTDRPGGWTTGSVSSAFLERLLESSQACT